MSQRGDLHPYVMRPLLPYQQGAFGVIAEGANADLILVDCNPLEDIDLVAAPHENFDLMIKDGMICKTEIE
ncbi:Xaa-Pro dipeptidase [Meridianimarinicoccus aquatilis]|uniref:Xaa-Pro dipeptidase n=1 Tax=Meridianimarinicoccus aquatilis TaxID=2552766 RepID=A0A4R6B3L5_9RHOB|nr:Xaa-Pro dipeptidase [Fluviibacterium aquatile]TDL90844.1 Xaa-Pro dipeptidase [Fluviibacterium aquatile]